MIESTRKSKEIRINNHTRPLRKNRDFSILWLGQAGSQLGSRISYVAYPLLTLAITHSPEKAGLVGFFGTVPWLLFSLPIGALSDRWDRKRVMILSDIMRALALGSLGVAISIGKVGIALIAIVAFIEGTFTVAYWVCVRGAIRRIVPKEQVSTAIARSEAKEYGASAVGPAVGGFLYEMAAQLPFFCDAISYAASLISLSFIRTPFQEQRHKNTGKITADIKDGVTWLWRRPFLRTSALLAAGGNFLSNGLYLMVIVAARGIGSSAGTVGLVMAGSGVGGIVGALVAPSLLGRVPLRRVVISVPWTRVIVLPVIIYFRNPIVLAAAFGAIMSTAPVFNAAVVGYRTMVVPDNLQARVQSAASLIAQGTGALGPLAAGMALASLGTRGSLIALWIASFSLALWSNSRRSVRQLDETPFGSTDSSS